MKKTVLLILLSCVPKLVAQQASVASGGNATGSGGSSSYSVGQVTYISAMGSNGTVNQGVQQPYEIFTLGNDEFPDIKLEILVYPNPTNAFITLKIENQSLEDLKYQLFDISGKQIQSYQIKASETHIQMENLASAIYLLNVMNNNRLLKTFKIIKND